MASSGQLRVRDAAGPPFSPSQAIQGFLEALSVAAGRLPGSLDAQAGLYRSLLAGQRMLILIDNARDASQVRPLLPGSAGCLVLVTSRERLTGLIAAEAAVPVTLDVLTVPEARAMLRSRLGAARVLREPAAVDRLIEVTAGQPLGLSVAAARAAQRPSSSLAALAAELEDVQGRLDALDAGDGVTSVRAALSWSYQQLSEPAARMFRLLSLHPGPDVGAAAAASLAGLGPAPADRALDELSCTHLVAELPPAGSPSTTCYGPTPRNWPLSRTAPRSGTPPRAGCWITTCAARTRPCGRSTRAPGTCSSSRRHRPACARSSWPRRRPGWPG